MVKNLLSSMKNNKAVKIVASAMAATILSLTPVIPYFGVKSAEAGFRKVNEAYTGKVFSVEENDGKFFYDGWGTAIHNAALKYMIGDRKLHAEVGAHTSPLFSGGNMGGGYASGTIGVSYTSGNDQELVNKTTPENPRTGRHMELTKDLTNLDAWGAYIAHTTHFYPSHKNKWIPENRLAIGARFWSGLVKTSDKILDGSEEVSLNERSDPENGTSMNFSVGPAWEHLYKNWGASLVIGYSTFDGLDNNKIPELDSTDKFFGQLNFGCQF